MLLSFPFHRLVFFFGCFHRTALLNFASQFLWSPALHIDFYVHFNYPQTYFRTSPLFVLAICCPQRFILSHFFFTLFPFISNLFTRRWCKNGSCTARFPLFQNLIVAQLVNNFQHFIVLIPFVRPCVSDLTSAAEHFARFSWIRQRHGASMNAVHTFIVTYFIPTPCFTLYLHS